MNKECLFCKIINKEIDSYKLYEDDKVLIFLDINDEYKGHALLVPKDHYVTIDEIPEDLLTYMFKIIKQMKKKYEEKLNIDGFSIAQNNGISQAVKHFHIHLVPLFKEKKNLTKEQIVEIMTK